MSRSLPRDFGRLEVWIDIFRICVANPFLNFQLHASDHVVADQLIECRNRMQSEMVG